MSVTCPNCGTRVPGWALDLERGIAICEMCETAFDCATQLPARLRHSLVAAPTPPGMSVTLDDQPTLDAGYRTESPIVRGRLTIRLRLRPPNKRIAVRLAATVLWWALVIGYGLDPLLGPLLIVNVLVGLWLIQSLLVDVVNHTQVSADEHTLETRSGPLSLRRATRVPVGKLEEIVSVQLPPQAEGQPPTYAVQARLLDGETVVLASNLPTAEHALAFERPLVAHLGLRRKAQITQIS
jgi:hypothetical protein